MNRFGRVAFVDYASIVIRRRFVVSSRSSNWCHLLFERFLNDLIVNHEEKWDVQDEIQKVHKAVSIMIQFVDDL